MYFVLPQSAIVFAGAIATVMSRVSIVTCYGNRAKTCTAPGLRKKGVAHAIIINFYGLRLAYKVTLGPAVRCVM